MKKMDVFATHLPILSAAAVYACKNYPNLPIYELGIGPYSTTLLHGIAGIYGKRLVSLDSNQKWMKRFQYLTTSLHAFDHIVNWGSFVLPEPCAMCFVDNSSLPSERRSLCLSMVQLAQIVVMHDSDKENEDTLGSFKFKFFYENLVPNTVILSNFFDVEELFSEIFSESSHVASFLDDTGSDETNGLH